MSFYRKGFLWSVALHSLLLGSLIISLPESKSQHFVLKKGKAQKKQEIIKTSAVDGTKIEAEISRIQTEKKQKVAQEKARSEALKQQALQAKQNRFKEERVLKTLKAKQQRLLQKQQAKIKNEKQKLLALKREKVREEKRLEKSKQKRKQLNEKIAKEKQARELALAEQKKQEEEKAQKLAEEIKLQHEKELELAKAKKQQLVDAQVNRYKALLINAISQNWILPPNVNKNLSCRFEINLEPTGRVVKVTLLRSSGDPILDRSAQTAIYSASPLPVPSMPEAFEIFKVVSLTVKAENV